MTERVVLAYSGGLDTSVAISWIGKETGAEVVAVAIDLGQGGEDMNVIRERALQLKSRRPCVRGSCQAGGSGTRLKPWRRMNMGRRAR